MSTYLDRNFRAGMRAPSGLDGLGESQAYYSRIDADQNAMIVRLAEIAAADQGAWDGIWSTLQNQYIPGTAVPFSGWGWTKQMLQDAIVNLTPTKNPGNAEFGTAEQLLADTAAMVKYFKQIVPEQVAQMQADAAEFQEKVNAIPPMRSPEEVGWETFQSILKERASALASFGGSTIAIAGGVALALLLLARR